MVAADREPPVEPRIRSGSTSQGLLITLLGDFWFGRSTYIPSAALVELMREFGLSDQAARAALSRVQRAGFLDGERDGRRTMYRLSPESLELTLRRGRQILAFTAETPESLPEWNGRWTIVTYALATEQVDERREIRRRLRRFGFGPLQDAVWISPRVTADQLRRGFVAVPADTLTIFEDAHLGAEEDLDVVRVWGLDQIADRYQDILDQVGSASELVRQGESVSPTAALRARTEAMMEWRLMPAVDPNLPPELLPDGWLGWEARRRFAEVYDALGPLAAERVRQIIEPHSAEAAAAVHFDSVGEPR